MYNFIVLYHDLSIKSKETDEKSNKKYGFFAEIAVN